MLADVVCFCVVRFVCLAVFPFGSVWYVCPFVRVCLYGWFVCRFVCVCVCARARLCPFGVVWFGLFVCWLVSLVVWFLVVSIVCLRVRLVCLFVRVFVCLVACLVPFVSLCMYSCFRLFVCLFVCWPVGFFFVAHVRGHFWSLAFAVCAFDWFWVGCGVGGCCSIGVRPVARVVHLMLRHCACVVDCCPNVGWANGRFVERTLDLC